MQQEFCRLADAGLYAPAGAEWKVSRISTFDSIRGGRGWFVFSGIYNPCWRACSPFCSSLFRHSMQLMPGAFLAAHLKHTGLCKLGAQASLTCHRLPVHVFLNKYLSRPGVEFSVAIVVEGFRKVWDCRAVIYGWSV